MQLIDDQTTAQNYLPKDHTTHKHASLCYFYGESDILTEVSDRAGNGQHGTVARMKCSSMEKFWHNKRDG